MWIEMFIFGILLTVAVLGIYFLNLPKSTEAARGAAFTAIVIFELVNLYIIRSKYKTSFFSNKGLFWAVLVAIIIQITIVYTPLLNRLFEVAPIGLFDWLYIIVFSAVIWAILKLTQKFLDQINFMTEKAIQ